MVPLGRQSADGRARHKKRVVVGEEPQDRAAVAARRGHHLPLNPRASEEILFFLIREPVHEEDREPSSVEPLILKRAQTLGPGADNVGEFDLVLGPQEPDQQNGQPQCRPGKEKKEAEPMFANGGSELFWIWSWDAEFFTEGLAIDSQKNRDDDDQHPDEVGKDPQEDGRTTR